MCKGKPLIRKETAQVPGQLQPDGENKTNQYIHGVFNLHLFPALARPRQAREPAAALFIGAEQPRRRPEPGGHAVPGRQVLRGRPLPAGRGADAVPVLPAGQARRAAGEAARRPGAGRRPGSAGIAV